jgi:adenine-specific DNA-methyltransferase
MSVEKLKILMPSSYKGFNYETENDVGGDFVIKNELYNTNSFFNEETRPNLVFDIHYNFKTNEVRVSDITENANFKDFVKIRPKKNNDGVHKFHAWRWSRDKIIREVTDLKFVKVDNTAKIFTKIRAYDTTSLKDIITDITTTSGLSEIKNLFDDKKFFDYPKPVELIDIFISQTKESDIILDFFAGSGTTAHAVMDLNAEEENIGNRKWICVQLPEITEEESEAYKAGYKTIAEISRERIRRAGKKIGKGDIGFKSYKLSSSNYRQWNTVIGEKDEKEILKTSKLFLDKPLVDKFDEKSVVYEILVKEGFDLNNKVEQEKGDLKPWVVIGIDKKIVVTFAEKIFKEQVEKLKLSENDTFVCFDSALDDTTKVNLGRNLNVKVI